MAEWEDYYEVLGVGPDAGPDDIRHAFRARALEFHPDRLFGVAEEEKRTAEDRLKLINRANEVLRDPDSRGKYHEDWLSKNAPPVPTVSPAFLRFDDVGLGQQVTGSFVISNSGGPYENIRITNPDSWVKVAGYRSLSQDDELPLRVDLEATGRDWGTNLAEAITVALDDQETGVDIGLRTRAAPVTRAATPAESRARPTDRPIYSRQAPGPFTYSLDGAALGMRWGGIAGGLSMMAVAVVLVLAADYQPFATAFLAAGLGIVLGLLGAVLGAVVGGIGGTLIGLVYGAISRP